MNIELSRYHLWGAADAAALGIGEPADESRFDAIGNAIIRRFRLLPADGCWAGLVRRHQILLDAIAASDARGVAACLADLIRNDVGFGMIWSRKEWDLFVTQETFRAVMAHVLKDNAWSLAEAVGILQAENPEARQAPVQLPSMETLCDAIDRFAGFPLLASPCFSLNFGLKRPGGVLDHRTMWAFLTSQRILDLLRMRGIAPGDAHVLEIGGGVGNLARLCLKRGIGRHTIVDLPTVRAIQTYMAMSEFPDLEIGFEHAGCRLNLLLPDRLREISPGSVAIVVNEDSLPEMAEETAAGYLAALPGLAAGGHFLSINHESQQTLLGHRQTLVPGLVRQFPRFGRLSRARHWMRRGYVEEVYALG